MNAPGHKLLAHAGFPADQYGSAGTRCRIRLLQNITHGPAGIDKGTGGTFLFLRGQNARGFPHAFRRLVPAAEQHAQIFPGKLKERLIRLPGAGKLFPRCIQGVKTAFPVRNGNAEYPVLRLSRAGRICQTQRDAFQTLLHQIERQPLVPAGRRFPRHVQGVRHPRASVVVRVEETNPACSKSRRHASERLLRETFMTFGVQGQK